jgi:hypothetical protein
VGTIIGSGFPASNPSQKGLTEGISAPSCGVDIASNAGNTSL